MKNIIVIGPPRAGKSSLTNLLADKYNYQIIRGDTLRKAFEVTFPELDISAITAINHNSFKKYICKFLDLNLKYPRNIHAYIIESCDITIEDYQRYFENENTILCVLGLANITSKELLQNIRYYDSDADWSNRYSDTYMLEKCNNYIEYSKKLKQLCKKYQYHYFETSYHNRKEIFNEILKAIEKEISVPFKPGTSGEPMGMSKRKEEKS